MFRRSLCILLLIAALPFLAACGDGASSAPSESSPVTITLATNPDPLAKGRAELIVTLTDPSGKPVDNATVNVLASHTGHSGMLMQGAATAQGNGRYALNADVPMAGTWQFTVKVRGVAPDTVRKDFKLDAK